MNGYDESMEGKGKNDKEFGIRLINNGVKAFNLKYYGICHHLEHGDGDRIINNKVNNEIFELSKMSAKTWTKNGIVKRTKDSSN